jgi:hypothetical protein
MPQRDPGVYLEDIEYYAAAAVRFISTYSLEQYLTDEISPRIVRIAGLQEPAPRAIHPSD